MLKPPWYRRGAGVAVFVVSLLTYALTLEPTVSLWDCGEFIAASYKLQVVHPPGAPFFLMLNRLFSLFASSPDRVPLLTNFQSALFSALAAFVLYWTVLFLLDRGGRGLDETAKILSAVLGALVFTFTDTVWFSAVETEVYALSTFLMAVSFWVMLRWERTYPSPGHWRYWVLLGYLMGIAVGVHLLSMVVLPIMGLVYYFTMKGDTPFRWKKFLMAVAGGVLAFGVLYVGNLRILPWAASQVDLWAVNGLGLPYWSGVIAFLVLLMIGLVALAWYFQYRKPRPLWNALVWAYLMSLLGVTSYAMVVIRSMADPPIDMNSPEDIFSLRSYLNREQYGDRPLLRGPSFVASPVRYTEGEMWYVPHHGRYEPTGHKLAPEYRKSDLTWFPRLGDRRDDRVRAYKQWLGLRDGEKPTFSDNIRFFFTYQLGHMGWRYFAWNYLGRQNDIEGRGEPHQGNWITGIDWLDRARVGAYALWPDWMKANWAYNPLWMLPFLLGLLGMWYQYRKERGGFWYVFAFIFMTGIALIVYLNNPTNEPRERDYTLVGAFYGFAMWVGIGGAAFYAWLRKKVGSGVGVLPIVALLALTFAMPAWVASREWNDHDRSGRYLIRNLAYNILMSCDSNAILIVNGDNSTYPVWYLQEVEGVRTDVRVVNYQLLGSGWYVERLSKDAHGHDAIRFSLPMDAIRRDEFMLAFYRPMKGGDRPMDLRKVLRFMGSGDPRSRVMVSDGKSYPYYPTRRFYLPVDEEAALRSGVLRKEELPYAPDTIYFSIGNRNQLYHNAIMMLDIIASNLWDRPISMVITSGGHVLMGLMPYARQRGYVYTITPLRKPEGMAGAGWVDLKESYPFLREKFRWGRVGLDASLWFGSVERRQLWTFRNIYLRTAIAYLQAGDKERFQTLARMAIDRSLPYMRPRLDAISWTHGFYQVGDTLYARKVALPAIRQFRQNIRYFESLSPRRRPWAARDLNESRQALELFRRLAKDVNDPELQKALP